MIFELSTDNIITIVALAGTAISGALGFGINIVSSQNKALKEELDELRDCLQNTRENYVTKEEFKDTTNAMMIKLDRIMELLATKPSADFCEIMHNRVGKLEK